MCVQNESANNTTTTNLSKIEIFCDLFFYYEYNTKHVFNVRELQILYLSLTNVTFEVSEVFEKSFWNAFLTPK